MEGVGCYAFRAGPSWEAICVDFDISVAGASLAEVKSSLETAIELYLEEAAEAEPDHRQYLLARRSPWLLRMKLALLGWASAVRTGAGEHWKITLRPEVPALR